MAGTKSKAAEARRARAARLGLRVDARTKRLVERAAYLQRRSVTDFCVTTLTEAATRTIEQHEALVLSEADRQKFFDVVMHPPKPSARLRRGFAAERRRVGR